MKNNFIFLFATLIIFIVLSNGCSSSKQEDAVTHQISGKLMVVGNEPFTSLAVLIYPDKAINIECPKDLETELLQNQGKYVEVTYENIFKKNNVETVKVIKAKIL